MAGPDGRFEAVTIGRRDLGPHDVRIGIAYAGICPTDVHHARAEFGTTYYPIVPGHEIAGTVSDQAAGAGVIACGEPGDLGSGVRFVIDAATLAGSHPGRLT